MRHDRPDRRFYGFAKYARCWLGAWLWPLLLYVDRNSIAISQLLNTLTGGEPHETLSSRTWRRLVHSTRHTRHGTVPWRAYGWVYLAAILEFCERDHCMEAYRRAYNRARLMEIERLPPFDA